MLAPLEGPWGLERDHRVRGQPVLTYLCPQPDGPEGEGAVSRAEDVQHGPHEGALGPGGGREVCAGQLRALHPLRRHHNWLARAVPRASEQVQPHSSPAWWLPDPSPAGAETGQTKVRSGQPTQSAQLESLQIHHLAEALSPTLPVTSIHLSQQRPAHTHSCTLTPAHTGTRAHTPTHIHAHNILTAPHTHVFSHMHARVHTETHMRALTPMHAHTCSSRAHLHKHRNIARMPALSHTQYNSHVHTRVRAHSHTCTLAHGPAYASLVPWAHLPEHPSACCLFPATSALKQKGHPGTLGDTTEQSAAPSLQEHSSGRLGDRERGSCHSRWQWAWSTSSHAPPTKGQERSPPWKLSPSHCGTWAIASPPLI